MQRGEKKHEILFILSPFYEYSNLRYIHVHRVHQAEYGIHIRVAASQEYVNTYSTRRLENHFELRGTFHTPFVSVSVLITLNYLTSLLTLLGSEL